MKNADQPAYPVSEETTDRIDKGISIYTGLTKRERLAAMAMQGLMGVPEVAFDSIVRLSVEHADALLAELEK